MDLYNDTFIEPVSWMFVCETAGRFGGVFRTTAWDELLQKSLCSLPVIAAIRLFRYYTLWCNASCHFRTWRGQNFLWDECPRKTVTELEELITPVLHLSISAPWVYLWSFLNPITNPQKQLYKKKSLLGPGLLHNIIHIWRGRDFMSRQQEPTHPGGLP